jgi:Bacterial Ig domain/PKD domain
VGTTILTRLRLGGSAFLAVVGRVVLTAVVVLGLLCGGASAARASAVLGPVYPLPGYDDAAHQTHGGSKCVQTGDSTGASSVTWSFGASTSTTGPIGSSSCDGSGTLQGFDTSRFQNLYWGLDTENSNFAINCSGPQCTSIPTTSGPMRYDSTDSNPSLGLLVYQGAFDSLDTLTLQYRTTGPSPHTVPLTDARTIGTLKPGVSAGALGYVVAVTAALPTFQVTATYNVHGIPLPTGLCGCTTSVNLTGGFYYVDRPPVADFSVSKPTPGNPVTFMVTSKSDPDGTVTHWSWDLNGDGIYGDQPNVSPVAIPSPRPGQHTVGLQVVDDDNTVTNVTHTFPIPGPPSCVDQGVSTPAGGAPITIKLACSGLADSPVAYAARSQPAHGSLSALDSSTGTVSYTPQAGYSGADKFTYGVTDPWGTSNTATVTITIPPAVPQCQDLSERVPPGSGAIPVSLSCSGPPGVPTTYSIVSSPAHGRLGTLDQANHQIIYNARVGYVGTDSFTYSASNWGGTSRLATVTITIPVSPPKPKVEIVGPGHARVGVPAAFRLTVVDSSGTPNFYRWTVGNRTVGTRSSLGYTFRRPGIVVMMVVVGDDNDNTFTGRLRVKVTYPRMKVDLHYTYTATQSSLVFTSMTVAGVPLGARLTLVCGGHGCPLGKPVVVKAPSGCQGKRCGKKRQTSALKTRNIDLTRYLHGRHFPVGSRLTMLVRKRQWVGEVVTLTFGEHGPAKRTACLAPGKTRPGKGC